MIMATFHFNCGGASYSYDCNYWPNYELNYRPVTKHHRLHQHAYAPTAYSLEPAGPAHTVTYPRQRRTLLDLCSSPLPGLQQRADSLFPFPQDPPIATYQQPQRDQQGYSSSYTFPLNVTFEVRSVEATISWSTPSFTARSPFNFTYVIHVESGQSRDAYSLACWKTHLTIRVHPGTYYNVQVEAVTQDKAVVARGATEFKAVFDSHELMQVYHLSLSYLRPLSEGNYPSPCAQRFYVFYRNKPTAYFDQVSFEDHGIMKTYRKDDNGHPASPINGEIDGLFFNARRPGGHLPKTSPFGNVRISIPAEYLLTPMHKLYFCDFYCNNSTHYVTVAACLPNSSTDLFCSRWLLPLDPTNNVFLTVRTNPCTGALEHFVNASIWVEFYYTEDVPLSWGTFDTVVSTGQSKPNGVPNNKYCTVCNLYPLSPTSSPSLPAAPLIAKRRATNEDEPAPKRMRSSADFSIPQKDGDSTFSTAMAVQKEQSVTSGERLECFDPVVIEVMCYIVDQTVKNEQRSIDSDAGSRFGHGSPVTSPIATLPRSVVEADSSSVPLVDTVYSAKVEALKEFRERKGKIAKNVQTVEEMLAEAKNTADGLCKKMAKFD